MTTTYDFDREIAEARERNARNWMILSTSKMGEKVETGAGTRMVVVSGSYPEGAGMDLEGDELVAVLKQTPFVEVCVTDDGKFANPKRWHEGPTGDADEWVFFERWSARGRESHGWVHPTSRCWVQVG